MDWPDEPSFQPVSTTATTSSRRMRSLNPNISNHNNATPFTPSNLTSSSARSDISSSSRKSNPRETPSRTSKKAATATTTRSTTTTVRLNPRITAATTASAARRQQTIQSAARAPLRPRDQNALSRARTPFIAGRSKPPNTSDMPLPHDHHHKGAGGGTPRQPVLSAAAAKAMTRTPLTPKVASSNKTQQPHVTPLAARHRKTDQHSTLNGGGPTARDDVASPVSAFLTNNNITPRSGTRQHRVDSANSTPTGTPNPERTSDWDTRSGYDSDHVKRHVVTFSPPSDAGSRHDAPVDSKFFYASDARTGPQLAATKPHVTPSSNKPPSSSFMYASGGPVERTRPISPGVSSPGFTPMLAPTHEAQPSKFFYANGSPDLQAPFRPSSSSGPGSTVSSSSKMGISRTSTGTSVGGAYLMASPASPTKPQHPQLAAAPKGPAISQQIPHRPPPLASPHTLGPPAATAKRRVSIETSPQPSSHSRAGSVSSGDAMIMSKFMAAQTSQGSSEASSPAVMPAMTMASIIQAAEDFAAAESEESKEQSELQSPTKSHAGDPLNDLVANARRERKVQDLEITNASLEAINRSLERQLRKQTAELRRYRRLSRSGRLSMMSVASSRVPSDSTMGTAVTMEGLDLSDLSEEDEEEDEEEYDSMYDTDPSEADSDSSPGLKAADRRRKRDEKRLQLDLTKHRELLVDSQKINQSIKRCLDWTEELIKDGKKALDYHVRVSDVDLAPRVLPPQYEDDNDDTQDLSRLDEEDEEADPETPSKSADDMLIAAVRGLGLDYNGPSPIPPSSAPALVNGANLAPPGTKEPPTQPQDRDSGVELPVDSG